MEWLFQNFINNMKSFGDLIVWAFENFIYFMQQIWNAFLEIWGFIVSILWFLYYAWKTLIIWVAKLLWNILDWDVFINVNRAFDIISDFIGGPATIFMASLLFIIVVRILIAFVFKMMRLNIDYNSFDKNTRKSNAWFNSSDHHKRMNTRV